MEHLPSRRSWVQALHPPYPLVSIGLGSGVKYHLFLLQCQIALGTVWKVKARWKDGPSLWELLVWAVVLTLCSSLSTVWLGPVLWFWSPGSSSGVPGAALVGLWRWSAGEMGGQLAGVTSIGKGKTLVSAFSIQLEIPFSNVSGKPGK